jgi:hypothetical protein
MSIIMTETATSPTPSERLFETIERGKTFADALRLLPRAKYVSLKIAHGYPSAPGRSDLQSTAVAVPRKSAKDFLMGYGQDPQAPLYSTLTRHGDQLWLHIGCIYDTSKWGDDA